MSRAKTETIRVRVDSELKAQAEGVLEALGLDTGEAIRLFYQHLASQKRLPFDARIPNATTRRALRDADEGKNLIRYENFDDFVKAMKGE